MKAEMLRRIKIYLMVILATTIVLMLCAYDSNHWNGMDAEGDNSVVDKFFNRLYFTCVTYSTIGYGDISPATVRSRMITMVMSLIVMGEFITLVFGTKWNS